MNEKGQLAINPIKFNKIRFLGKMGSDWISIEYRLSKLLTQNVLYASYHEPKTIEEIADLLWLSKNHVENEIDYLEYNGFMDRIDKNKYISKILIHDLSNEVVNERKKIFEHYANLVCEKYNLFHNNKLPFTNNIYTPNDDQNFLLYSIISICCAYKFENPCFQQMIKKHLIKRNDGSENIPFTYLDNEQKPYVELNLSLKATNGKLFKIFITNSIYDNRSFDWSQIFQKEFIDLYDFISSPDDKNTTNLNNLMKKGYLVEHEQNKPLVNLVTSELDLDDIVALLPDFPKDFIELNNSLGDELFNISKSCYPKHIHDLCYTYYKNSLFSGEMIINIIDNLISNGILKPLEDFQKNTVNMILFL